MLCSVVIPLYNKAAFIEKAIQSVLDQTYGDFEIVVIDDGSQDAGPRCVEAMPDTRIRLVRQANQGVSAARNRGIELARGELVCFLDADDWYHPRFLETVNRMATDHPEVAFFATSYEWVSTLSVGDLIVSPDQIDDITQVDDLYRTWRTKGPFFCASSVALRFSALTPEGPWFPLGDSMGEDQDLWFRLAEKERLLFCAAPLAAYRIDVADSLCGKNQERGLPTVYRRVYQRVVRGQLPVRLRASALRLVAHSRVSVARNLLSSGRRFSAMKELIAAWRDMPSRRWWVSMLMCCIASPALFRRWERWRQQSWVAARSSFAATERSHGSVTWR